MNKEIKLWSGHIPYYDESITNDENKNTSSLTPFLIKTSIQKSCMLVFAGGSYEFRSDQKEGVDVCLWLNSIGINAFIVNYRVSPYDYKAILSDARKAMKHVRMNATKYNINPDKIGVIGFSAGGHLAGMLANDLSFEHELDDVNVSARPNLSVLCYPVVSLTDYAHLKSTQILVGNDVIKAHKFSLQNSVTNNTPPTFIWHTIVDMTVSVMNPIMLIQSLVKYNVPFESHIFPTGKHGLALLDEDLSVKQWSTLCEVWLRSNGF
jgi:acetyl esterase/lipase